MSSQKKSEYVTKEYLNQVLDEKFEKFAIMVQAGFRELGERMTKLEIRLDKLEYRVGQLELRMDSLEERLDGLTERLIRIESVVLN